MHRAMSGVRLAAAIALVALTIAAFAPVAQGIGCFLCSSKNGSNPNCEDPYHPGHSTYAENCMVGKKNHVGRFPASFCVKITGTSTATDESLMIRICVLENMDSQCGLFKFENETMTGCILTCNDDGCNKAVTSRGPSGATVLLGLLVVAALRTMKGW